MKTLRSILRTTLRGLVVILPLVLLVLVLYWIAYSLESGLRSIFRWVIPDVYYFRGMGVGLGLLLVYSIGVLMSSPFLQRRFQFVQMTLKRIPLIRTLYGGLLDIVEFASVEQKKKFNRVVSIKVGDSEIRLIGFVTGEDFASLGLGKSAAAQLGVYIPMSYQIGGFFALVPRSAVESLDLSIEDASRMVFTAGMSAGRQKGGRRHASSDDSAPPNERRAG